MRSGLGSKGGKSQSCCNATRILAVQHIWRCYLFHVLAEGQRVLGGALSTGYILTLTSLLLSCKATLALLSGTKYT